jgi:hypothetical protein
MKVEMVDSKANACSIYYGKYVVCLLGVSWVRVN